MKFWQTKDDYKIMVSGDSISKGVIFNEEKGKYVISGNGYVDLLENKLKGIVSNVAKFGNTIIRGIGKLNIDIDKNKPDILLIEYGGNDCDFDWEQIAKNPGADHQPKTAYDTFINTLNETVSFVKNKGITPVLMTLPPLDAERYFKWVSKSSAQAASDIMEWLGSVTKIYWWQERYNAAILNIAQETKTLFIDVRGAFLQFPDYRKFLCVDGIHPNEEGHKLIANKIQDYIHINYDFLLKKI